MDKTFVPTEGGSKETDVEEVIAVGSLELVPEHRADYWILRVHMEDELGNRLSVEEAALEGAGADLSGEVLGRANSSRAGHRLAFACSFARGRGNARFISLHHGWRLAEVVLNALYAQSVLRRNLCCLLLTAGANKPP